jgi:hypothetical protein
MNGPIAVAILPKADHAPIALPRSSSANDAWIMAKLLGVGNAAPMPSSARAATSSSMDGATTQRADATANHSAPMTKIRRRPMVTERNGKEDQRRASVTVYPVMVHCNPSNRACRSFPTAGNAMLTTVTSSDAMADPRTAANENRLQEAVR